MVNNWRGALPEPCQTLFDELKEARRKLIENNLPLALNRAKLFYRKTNSDHLSLSDYIQSAVLGLSSGIDKFSGKYSKSWVSTCIGRIGGCFTEMYSETQIYLYPSDRQILYRARALMSRQKIEDLSVLTRAVNSSLLEDKKQGRKIYKTKVTEGELANLLTATHILSTDAVVNEEDGNKMTHMDLIVRANIDIEKIDEDQSLTTVLRNILELPLKMQKIMKLRGIHF